MAFVRKRRKVTKNESCVEQLQQEGIIPQNVKVLHYSDVIPYCQRKRLSGDELKNLQTKLGANIDWSCGNDSEK